MAKPNAFMDSESDIDFEPDSDSAYGWQPDEADDLLGAIRHHRETGREFSVPLDLTALAD